MRTSFHMHFMHVQFSILQEFFVIQKFSFKVKHSEFLLLASAGGHTRNALLAQAKKKIK